MKVVEAKIVVLGSQGVGKTSLVVRYIGKMFSKHISPTIGASFFTCNINLEDSRIKLQVWDTAGQERFRSMAPMYYRNANAALLVYDITSANSFASIKGWVKELQSNVGEPIVLSLVGNKCDLERQRAVPRGEAAQYAKDIGAAHCETSALHDQGIDQVFLNTATELLKMSSSSLVSSLRSYDSRDEDKIPIGVGKTSLVVRYIGKMFSKHISPTIGASFFTCNINLEDSRIKLQVWDTAGQERFRSMAPMYYRNANAALLVYDITSANSFASIKGWVKELQSNVGEPIVLSLVGNKCDLERQRAVPRGEAAQYAKDIGAAHCETSALHDQGIDQVFLNTATELLKMSSSSLVSSLRSYDSRDEDKIPIGVGKTSLVVRYIGKMFSKHISPTIGASFFTCNINLEDSRIKLQVWDTAGQERFRSMAPMYYRNANAALLVYDITSANSFASIKGWVKELQSNVGEPIVLSLVGNKCDLERQRAVPRGEAAQYAKDIGAAHCETSALHDQGIDQVFLNTATELLKMSSSSLVSSLRSYDSRDEDKIPIGAPTEEKATHTGKVELPAWKNDVKVGELQRSMCC